MASKRVMKLPKHLGPLRSWKASKRGEARRVAAALDELRIGCAFLPENGMRDVLAAIAAIESLRATLAVKKWGR